MEKERTGSTVNLKIRDRILFEQLFPQQGNLIEQIMVREIAKKIRLSPAEIEKVELRDVLDKDNNPTGNVVWNLEKDTGKEVVFSESEIEFLKKQIRRLDETNQINQQILDLCVLINEIKKKTE